MQNISTLESLLTYHIRQYLCKNYSNETIKKVSFTISLITCLFDASVVTFALFTPHFMNVLHYNQFNINIIGGFISIGMYLTLPVLGYLADTHGPVLLALLSMIMFFPGYSLAALTYTHHWSYIVMSLGFAMIGCGTSAVYFCSLLTCAKIYPERKGLSISAPVAFFGLSSYLLTLIFNSLKVLHDEDGNLNIYKVFIGLSIMYFIIGVLNFCSSVIVTIEKDLLFKREQGNITATTTTTPANNNTVPGSEEGQECNERSALIRRSNSIQSEHSFMEPQEMLDHNIKYNKFLKDKSMYVMFIVLFLLAGPLELFITTMGSISSVIGDINDTKDISSYVKYFSVFSTFTRLFVGISTDYIHSKFFSPIILLLVATIIGLIGNGLISVNYPDFELVSTLIGISYGGIFTLFPTITAEIWGVEILGSTWGLFLSAPAIGSLLFGIFYALEFDKYCLVNISSFNSNSFFNNYCLSLPFGIFTFGFLVGLILIIICWRAIWIRRGLFSSS